MAVNTDAVGKRYPPVSYLVGREKIREYAAAVGETNRCHHELEAARSAGYADLVAPPMFAVVYAARSLALAMFDPEVGLDYARLLHLRQQFEWGPLVLAGDEISTVATVEEIAERVGNAFYVFQTSSANQRGEQVCVGKWTEIVRVQA
jgi:acyl dehydratase